MGETKKGAIQKAMSILLGLGVAGAFLWLLIEFSSWILPLFFWLLIGLASLTGLVIIGLIIAAWAARVQYQVHIDYPRIQSDFYIKFFKFGQNQHFHYSIPPIEKHAKDPSKTTFGVNDFSAISHLGNQEDPFRNQRGFAALPQTPLSLRQKVKVFFVARLERLAKAGIKLVTDPGLYKRLLMFVIKVIRYVIQPIWPQFKLRHLTFGHSNVKYVSQFAAVWSSVSPILRLDETDVNYQFHRKAFALELDINGEASALQLIGQVIKIFLAFPWWFLFVRFFKYYFNPGLNVWQQKIWTSSGMDNRFKNKSGTEGKQ